MNNSVQPYPTSTVNFNENAHKFMCCCGCMHSRMATLVLSILEIIFFMVAAGFSVYLITKSRCPFTLSGSMLATFLVHIIIISTAIYGANKEKSPSYLIPHVILQSLSIVGIIAFIVYYAVFTFTINIQKQQAIDFVIMYYIKTVTLTNFVVILTSFLLALVFKIWSLVVISKCCNYLRAKHKVFGHIVHNHRHVFNAVSVDNGQALYNTQAAVYPPAVGIDNKFELDKKNFA